MPILERRKLSGIAEEEINEEEFDILDVLEINYEEEKDNLLKMLKNKGEVSVILNEKITTIKFLVINPVL